MKRLAAAVAAVFLLAGCTGDPEPASSASPSARACGSPVGAEALPSWARTGFSGDGSGIKHVFGDRGEIVAILFGAPLSAPPAPDRNNKILWVSRQPVETPGSLEITAVLDGTAERANQTIQGGPGPSIVDLPRDGCWRLTLSWSGRTDTLDLTYKNNS